MDEASTTLLAFAPSTDEGTSLGALKREKAYSVA